MQGEIHLHVKRDGTLLMLGATDSTWAWHAVTLARLQALIERGREVKAPEAAIAYTRDDPDRDPTAIVETTFKAIASFGLPIRLAREPFIPIT